MANLTINKKPVEVKGIEDLVEIGECSDNSASYFLAIGVGILEILANEKVCPKFSSTLQRSINNQIKQVEEIAESAHLEAITVCKNIIGLVQNPEHEITDIMNWLDYYFSQNSDAATESLLITIKYIIFISAENPAIKAAVFNANSTTEELVKGYSETIISSFPVFIRIISLDKEEVFTGGDSDTYPVINIYQEANSYSLAYFKEHLELKDSAYAQRDLQVHPFIYDPMSPKKIKKVAKPALWGAIPTVSASNQASSSANVVTPAKIFTKPLFDLTKKPNIIESVEESESSSDDIDSVIALESIKQSSIQTIRLHKPSIISDGNDIGPHADIPPVPVGKPDLPPAEKIVNEKSELVPASKVSPNLATIISTISSELRENFLINDSIITQLERAVDKEPEIKNIPGIQEILDMRHEKFTENQCKVCKIEKQTDEFTLVSCDKGCKICSYCRAVKSSKQCLICRRYYDAEEQQLIFTLL